MSTWEARNVHEALPQLLDLLSGRGAVVPSRDGPTLEVRTALVTLRRPWERHVFQPHRNASPPALFAETLWVLAGRNDVPWLARYLPRAADFSDDGATWRAGYGPRLRRWPGATEGVWVDQVRNVARDLARDPTSRRAVISIWDPARDWPQSSVDIPCNGWLHFLIRDGRLHLSVAIRSNDIWWGWSGINTFEWSVLQELLAYDLGVPPGELTTFSDSLHLYTRHAARSTRLRNERVRWAAPCYAAPEGTSVPQAPWTTPLAHLDDALQEALLIEGMLRRPGGPDDRALAALATLPDAFLRTALDALAAANLVLAGAPHRARDWLLTRPDTDARAATLAWLDRQPTRAGAPDGEETPSHAAS